MKIYHSFIVLVFNLLFLNCSSRYAIISEEYEDKKIVGKSLAIVNLFSKPIIHNREEIKENLGDGIPEEVYLSFFKDRLVKELNNSGSFQSVNYLNDINKSLFVDTELVVSNEYKMKMLLPISSIKIDTTKYDYLLFIDSLILSRQKASVLSFRHNNTSPSEEEFEKLYEELNFLLWDNSEAKIVSYGNIYESVTTDFGISKWDLETLIIYIAKKFFRFSPFPFKTVRIK